MTGSVFIAPGREIFREFKTLYTQGESLLSSLLQTGRAEGGKPQHQ